MSPERLEFPPPAALPAKPVASSKPSAAGLPKARPPLAGKMLLQNRPLDLKKLPTVMFASLLLHAVALGVCALIVLKHPRLIEEIFTTVANEEESAEPIVEQSMLQPEDQKDTAQENIVSPETTANLQFETKGPIDLNISDGIPQIEADSSNLPGLADIKVGNETSGPRD